VFSLQTKDGKSQKRMLAQFADATDGTA